MAIALSFNSMSQAKLVEVESKVYKTTQDIEIQGQVGFLSVPENRNDESSRTIRVKYIWLQSLATNPEAPLVYIEGGGGLCTWQAEDPEELTYWIELLEVSDLIFIDRRGEGDEALNYIWKGAFPSDFFVSEAAANRHYEQMIPMALEAFEERGVDVRGYNIEEEARDVNELMTALGIERYNLFGFSFGSHIGMTIMTLFPDRVEKAILAGSDAPNQAFNFPSYLEDYVEVLSDMMKTDEKLSQEVPDFKMLVNSVMKQLEKEPAAITIQNPATGKKMNLNIGPFGLGLILRLDIDDYNDIPVLPRLFYTIQEGDYSLLRWFAQRRVAFALAVPGAGINQYIASGVSASRWQQIEQEAEESIFGNVVNLMTAVAKDLWVSNALSFDPSEPLKTDIPSLFITGTLDCRTPIGQVEETMKGFTDALHIKVENAGHEQSHWDAEVFDERIPIFIKGEEIRGTDAYYGDVNFIPVKGKAKGHPSLKK